MPRAVLPPDPGGRPEVIVDFECRDGLLFVALRNIGRASARRITTRFDRPFHGLDGAKRISTLTLFRRVEFMAPGREFVQFVDPLARYLARREPTRLTATVTYRDRDGRRYEDTITHDLRVFRDLGTVHAVR